MPEFVEHPTAKYYFGGFVIGVSAILQGVAWYTGHNGAISGAIMGIIGLTAGAILGFKWGISQK